MADLNVFISSTYQDLKHFRYSLKSFFKKFKYNIIEFENGDIPYLPNTSIFNSCLKEINNSEIFILIIGKRYGTSVEKIDNIDFCTNYKSITEAEFDKALKSNIPKIFTLLDETVSTEYRIYKNLNKKCEALENGFTTQSINTFLLLDKIYNLDIPIQKFSIFPDVKDWLLKQFSGIFSELLRKSKNIDESQKIIELANEYLEMMQKQKLDYFEKKTEIALLSKSTIIKFKYIDKIHNELSKSRNEFLTIYKKKYETLNDIEDKELRNINHKLLNDNVALYFDFIKDLLDEQVNEIHKMEI